MSSTFKHMYTPSKMIRNLGVGNIGEAFFRYWFETCCNELDDLSIRQFGYNPEGIVVGKNKKEMLKQLERSTDFAIYQISDLDKNPEGATPILGISVNTQKSPYSMEQARAPKLEHKGKLAGCYNCPRGDRCFNGKVENLWYNEYNISNDYRLFHDEFEADVVMVSVISKMPYIVWNGKVRKGEFDDEVREYLIEGKSAIAKNHGIVDFLNYLLFDQRYISMTRTRDYDLVWILYSDVLDGKITYHVTGAPVSRGRPRPVACIDIVQSRSEMELVKFIAKFSKFSPKQLPMTWYASDERTRTKK